MTQYSVSLPADSSAEAPKMYAAHTALSNTVRPRAALPHMKPASISPLPALERAEQPRTFIDILSLSQIIVPAPFKSTVTLYSRAKSFAHATGFESMSFTGFFVRRENSFTCGVTTTSHAFSRSISTPYSARLLSPSASIISLPRYSFSSQAMPSYSEREAPQPMPTAIAAEFKSQSEVNTVCGQLGAMAAFTASGQTAFT